MAGCLSFFTGIQLPDAMISLWELLFTCPYLRSFVPLLGFCLGNLFNDLSGYLLGPIYIFLPGHIFLVHFHNLKKTSLLTLALKKGKTRKKKGTQEQCMLLLNLQWVPWICSKQHLCFCSATANKANIALWECLLYLLMCGFMQKKVLCSLKIFSFQIK